MTYIRNDEDEADVDERVFARVENYPFDIDFLLADSGFYNERVIRRARDIAATVVHVPKKGERMKDKLDGHKSYMTTYRLLRLARGITTTRDPVVWFAIMLVAALRENLWLVLRWAVVARGVYVQDIP